MKNTNRTMFLALLLFLFGCSNENTLPEYNGVYARHDDGTLIKLDALSTSTSAWLDMKGSVSILTIANARSHLHGYAIELPKVTLDINKVNAFIVKSGGA